MQAKLDAHPLFERASDADLESDPAAGLLAEGTEEGQKVMIWDLHILMRGRSLCKDRMVRAVDECFA